MGFEPAKVVPFREYPAAVRPIVGVRHVTVCAVHGEGSAEYEHGYLLWSDGPFTASVVAREMTSLGSDVLNISPTRNAKQQRPTTS